MFDKRDFAVLAGLALLGYMVVCILIILAIGWGLMLLMGALHSFIPAIPAIGYWASVGIIFILNILLGLVLRLRD
jgi:hypothetical protein